MTTDVKGEFEISHVAFHSRWSFAAGMDGSACRRPLEGVVANGKDTVSLVMERLYGCIIRLRNESFGPVRTSASLHSRQASRGRMLDSRARWVEPTNPALALSNADSRWMADTPTHEYPALYTADPALDRIGPYEFTANVPGYQPTTEQLWLEPISHAPPVHDIALVATATSWGDLEVLFLGACGQGSASVDGLMRLELRSASTDDTYQLAIRSFSPGAALFRGIPSGVYSVTYQSCSSFGTNPFESDGLRTVTISEGSSGLDIDVSVLGCLVVNAQCGSEQPYQGKLVLEIVRLAPNGTDGAIDHALFRSGPYVIPNLPAGQYRFDVVYPASTKKSPTSEAIVVSSGVVNDLTLRVECQ